MPKAPVSGDAIYWTYCAGLIWGPGVVWSQVIGFESLLELPLGEHGRTYDMSLLKVEEETEGWELRCAVSSSLWMSVSRRNSQTAAASLTFVFSFWSSTKVLGWATGAGPLSPGRFSLFHCRIGKSRDDRAQVEARGPGRKGHMKGEKKGGRGHRKRFRMLCQEAYKVWELEEIFRAICHIPHFTGDELSDSQRGKSTSLRVRRKLLVEVRLEPRSFHFQIELIHYLLLCKQLTPKLVILKP